MDGSESLNRKYAVYSLGHVWFFDTLWNVGHQAPLSMGFPRQEYWSGVPFPSPGDLPLEDPGIKPASPTLQADSLPVSHLGNPTESLLGDKSLGIHRHFSTENIHSYTGKSIYIEPNLHAWAMGLFRFLDAETQASKVTSSIPGNLEVVSKTTFFFP